jgi:ferric-dicitrate binding protein FerR (iron transport regulator)
VEGENMNRFTRRLAAVAAAGAAFVVVPAATGATGGLELSVVSSPAEYVSGDDARIEVAVPDGTALSAVTVTLNGADVTSTFGPDPEGNHQLEGVVTGLPLGETR